MEWPNVWAPWRIEYIRQLPRDGGAPACFLCDAWQRPEDDDALLVLHRSPAAMILMNRFPYTSGHLMVVPAEHAGDLVDLTSTVRCEIIELIALAERLIQTVLNPQGLNIGFNIGRAAGAGLPGHVHAHLVPRWGGDTNFISVVGQVRVIPQAMQETFEELKAALPGVLEDGNGE
ncbi:MAG: HIT domain-containing protein [Phycisphaeraceae bacterium]